MGNQKFPQATKGSLCVRHRYLIGSAHQMCEVAAFVVVDRRTLFGETTRHMMDCLQYMSANGVCCQVMDGQSTSAEYEAVGRAVQGFAGIQHAKGALVLNRDEAWAIVGSTNWTTASRANNELGVALRGKGAGVREI